MCFVVSDSTLLQLLYPLERNSSMKVLYAALLRQVFAL